MSPRSRRAAPVVFRVPADDRLLASDLDAWAGPRVAHAGRELALLGRVESLRLTDEGRRVEGRVRDSGSHPYRVSIAVLDGTLASGCDCAFESGPACKHAVAALAALRFPRPDLSRVAERARRPRKAGRMARGQGRIVSQAPVPEGTIVSTSVSWALTRDERIALARDEELRARRHRAKQERHKVARVTPDGGPATFHVSGRDRSASYLVTLRGATGQLASCTCPDFAKSELASCKHIERVRSWMLRQPKRFPSGILSIWWRPREWSDRSPDPMREIRLDADRAGASEALATWFESDGWLSAPSDGEAEDARAREAIDEARRWAEAEGLLFDLDPAVASRIEEASVASRNAERLGRIDRSSPAWLDIESTLGFDLHPYQEEGALFLARRGRAFLADDMGLGKTVQAIVASLLLRKTLGAAKALVICPASLKHQWKREIEKACGEIARVIEGPRATRLQDWGSWTGGFLVVNYELALRDLDAVQEARPDVVILDEAQRIKNWDTKTAKAVKQLTSPYAFVLTGTPLENRLTELHSLAEFLHERILGPRWRMLPYHAVVEPGGRIVAYEALDVLRKRMRPFFLRRERREVLDQLPPRTDNTFWTGMTPSQWRPYRRFARKVSQLLSQRRTLKAIEVRALLQALTSMRILCNGLAQFEWARAEGWLRKGKAVGDDLRWLGSPKLEEFANVLEDLLEEPSTKIVVFSQWERFLRLAHLVARPLLDRLGLQAEIFHGGLDGRSRGRILERFTTDPSIRVLFSTDAGGLGLNLQEAASVVVNLEVPWNPAVLEQRIGRVHRLGQRRSVQVLHFVTKGAIEERVLQVVENKKALFDGLLVEELDRIVLDESLQASFVERVRGLLS